MCFGLLLASNVPNVVRYRHTRYGLGLGNNYTLG